jgi:hypothetical protein
VVLLRLDATDDLRSRVPVDTATAGTPAHSEAAGDDVDIAAPLPQIQAVHL